MSLSMNCEPGTVSGTKDTMVSKTYGIGLPAACVLVEKTDKKQVNPVKVTKENKRPFWEGGVRI